MGRARAFSRLTALIEEAMAHSETPAGPAPCEPQAFYAECLRLLEESGIPYLLAGTYAINAHTGLERASKDLDIFCKAGDYPRILTHFQDKGYETAVEDERWIAKVKREAWFADVIFSSTSAVAPVTDQWFEEVCTTRLYGIEARVLPPTELVWSKLFVQDRSRYDGADVAHVILRQIERIDWERLLSYAEQYWEVLLAHLINFRFIYPSERHRIPRWLLDELLERLQQQTELPQPQTKVCRGRHFSRIDYLADITEWGFADIVGAADEQNERKA
jgi:hypothetical protein